jgi:hypothetical protein
MSVARKKKRMHLRCTLCEIISETGLLAGLSIGTLKIFVDVDLISLTELRELIFHLLVNVGFSLVIFLLTIDSGFLHHENRSVKHVILRKRNGFVESAESFVVVLYIDVAVAEK